MSVAEVLERQITTWIPAIAKEPGDPGDYSITGCQVSQHHSSANLPSHQEQIPGWYMGLSGWNWWAVRNHQVHSASAGWAKASLGSCSFVLKQMHEGLCSEKQHCSVFLCQRIRDLSWGTRNPLKQGCSVFTHVNPGVVGGLEFSCDSRKSGVDG